MNRSESIAELAGALAKAQAEIKTAPKDNTGVVRGTTKGGKDYEYKYQYSTLADVWDACRGPLSKNGIAVVQTAVAEGATAKITTLLAHSSGQWVEETLALLCKDASPQSIGSGITYGRRYTLAAMVGVVSDEDDDGAKAQHGNTNGHSKPAPAPARGLADVDPHEQQAALLMEACEAGFKTAADKEKWRETNREKINGLPVAFKQAVVAAFTKAEARS